MLCLQVDGVHVEASLQWCSDLYTDIMLGFVNSVKTVDGGTHMEGLKTALTRTFNGLARKLKLLKEGDPNLSGDHVREGLSAVISVKVGSKDANTHPKQMIEADLELQAYKELTTSAGTES